MSIQNGNTASDFGNYSIKIRAREKFASQNYRDHVAIKNRPQYVRGSGSTTKKMLNSVQTM